MFILGIACVPAGDAEEVLVKARSFVSGGGIICGGGAWQFSFWAGTQFDIKLVDSH